MFGWTLDEERSFAVLDAYVQAGGNFIDTADIYGRHGAGGIGGSERIIGRWLAARGNRERLVIATKVGMSAELPGLSRETIRRGVEGSLERLGVERIDLYYAHRDDEQTPLQETLAAFAELIEEGRVRHVAASNYSAARLAEALRLGAERAELASYVALQPHYNLMERDYERELAPALRARRGSRASPTSVSPAASSPASTDATGRGASPRAAGVRESYLDERGFAVLDALDEIAAAHGVALAAVALAWLRLQPTVLAPIASATSPRAARRADALRDTRAQLPRRSSASRPPAPAGSLKIGDALSANSAPATWRSRRSASARG